MRCITVVSIKKFPWGAKVPERPVLSALYCRAQSIENEERNGIWNESKQIPLPEDLQGFFLYKSEWINETEMSTSKHRKLKIFLDIKLVVCWLIQSTVVRSKKIFYSAIILKGYAIFTISLLAEKEKYIREIKPHTYIHSNDNVCTNTQSGVQTSEISNNALYFI